MTSAFQSKRSPPAASYEIRVESVLGQQWSAWFDGLRITHEADVTVIAGPVPDQAALLGLLARVQDLGLALISVRRIDPEPPDDSHVTQQREGKR